MCVSNVRENSAFVHTTSYSTQYSSYRLQYCSNVDSKGLLGLALFKFYSIALR